MKWLVGRAIKDCMTGTVGWLNISLWAFAPRSDLHGSESDSVIWCWLPVNTCLGSFRLRYHSFSSVSSRTQLQSFLCNGNRKIFFSQSSNVTYSLLIFFLKSSSLFRFHPKFIAQFIPRSFLLDNAETREREAEISIKGSKLGLPCRPQLLFGEIENTLSRRPQTRFFPQTWDY